MRHPVLLVLFVIVMASAACSTTVAGTPVKATGAQGALDFDQLDVGPFPTTPSKPLGVAGDPLRGMVIEAQRMANHVIGPWEVDPALTDWFGFGAMVLPKAQALGLIGPGELGMVVSRHNFINGFATARTEANKKLLLNAVLRFPDDDAAEAAATALGEAAMQQEGADGPAQTTSVPRHPDAKANTYTTVDRQAGKRYAVRSFAAHGPYVLMQLAQAPDSAEQAAELVAKTLDLQGPEIDRFRATAPSEFADISIDPTGLLARVIPVEAPDPMLTKNTTYERRGALHFQSDPTRSAKLFADTGTDLVAMAKASVYEAEDPAGAKAVVDEFYAEVSPTSKPANPVRNMPESRCMQLKDNSFYCLVTADEYAIEAAGPTLLTAQQLAAAQYIMLLS
ncbi:hypothetical protein H7I53_04480 [Mycolicibacterium pulveris]|uniref:Uncharacterized protein n=1 Tax=Mycolicibacterium pulveris TaxID=36813 RepID=A0A7I7UI06_MYCPV|nr:hypothetical protein [Mycolicibacterium pulveris]MCV6979482.1 hypothetical protein [Mycolicibacterium pulveris]BBY81074.1 hypothetical protein MPUL_22320 [Mycolicibacterium pulveris]